MRRKRRVIAVVVGLVCLLFVPPLVAGQYAREPGGVGGIGLRPDKGWQFIFDAVNHSRGAQLSSSQSADERARDVWAGARPGGRSRGHHTLGITARADNVALVWTDGSFTVPSPPGAPRPAPGNDVATPRSPFAWIVYGHLRGGARQMIGMLDYDSGRRLWDIRDGVTVP